MRVLQIFVSLRGGLASSASTWDSDSQSKHDIPRISYTSNEDEMRPSNKQFPVSKNLVDANRRLQLQNQMCASESEDTATDREPFKHSQNRNSTSSNYSSSSESENYLDLRAQKRMGARNQQDKQKIKNIQKQVLENSKALESQKEEISRLMDQIESAETNTARVANREAARRQNDSNLATSYDDSRDTDDKYYVKLNEENESSFTWSRKSIGIMLFVVFVIGLATTIFLTTWTSNDNEEPLTCYGGVVISPNSDVVECERLIGNFAVLSTVEGPLDLSHYFPNLNFILDGGIRIDNRAVTSVTFDNANADALEVDFTALQDGQEDPIVGSIKIQNNLDLTYIGMERLTGPVWKDMWIQHNPSLRNISFPRLSVVRSILLLRNPEMGPLVSFPVLEHTSSLRLSRCPSVRELYAPILKDGVVFGDDTIVDSTQGSSFTIRFNDGLETVNLNSITIPQGLLFDTNPMLKRISFPNVKKVSLWLEFSNHERFEDINMPRLGIVGPCEEEFGTELNAELNVNSNDLLRRIEFPVLETICSSDNREDNNQITTLRISYNPLLEEISMPLLKEIGDQIVIYGNPELRLINMPMLEARDFSGYFQYHCSIRDLHPSAEIIPSFLYDVCDITYSSAADNSIAFSSQKTNITLQ